MHTLVLLVVKHQTYVHAPVTYAYFKSQIMTLIAVNSGRVIAATTRAEGLLLSTKLYSQ